jgi:hypothetical protein
MNSRNDRSKWVGGAVALVLLLAIVIPVAAITYGEPDEGEHPYVGFMLLFDPTFGEDGGWFSCSGSALTGKLFLTAGHCTIDIGTNLNETPDRRGGTDVWVSYDEEVDLTDFPSRTVFTDPAELNQARFDWLNKNRDFTRGTAWAHDEYADFAGFPNTRDVGVVVLDKKVRLSQYAVLAELGTLDELATMNKNPKVIFETAGYGIQEVVPFFQSVDSRFKATSKLVELNSALTDGYNLHTSNNPSESQGKGGSCFGDSGGPVMLNDTNVVVAIVSFGENPNCKGADYGYRADIEETQDFVATFLN